jgi:hypothetical protein
LSAIPLISTKLKLRRESLNSDGLFKLSLLNLSFVDISGIADHHCLRRESLNSDDQQFH